MSRSFVRHEIQVPPAAPPLAINWLIFPPGCLITQKVWVWLTCSHRTAWKVEEEEQSILEPNKARDVVASLPILCIFGGHAGVVVT
jgi:hypothetical protein